MHLTPMFTDSEPASRAGDVQLFYFTPERARVLSRESNPGTGWPPRMRLPDLSDHGPGRLYVSSRHVTDRSETCATAGPHHELQTRFTGTPDAVAFPFPG